MSHTLPGVLGGPSGWRLYWGFIHKDTGKWMFLNSLLLFICQPIKLYNADFGNTPSVIITLYTWHQVCILLKDNLQIKTETCNKLPLQCGYRKLQIPLGLIDKTWHLSYSYDDALQTLWQREAAVKVGSWKGEGNIAPQNPKRIMILKGIIVVITPLAFCFKLLNVWSFLQAWSKVCSNYNVGERSSNTELAQCVVFSSNYCFL